MENSKRFLLLCLGLSLLTFYVSPTVTVYGGNPYEDVAKKLFELRSQKQLLEKKLANSPSMVSRRYLELDLENVKGWIQHFEATSKVSYKDYLKSLDEQNEKHEKERERLRKKLEMAENMRLQAMEAFSTARQDDRNQIRSFHGKLKELTAERNRMAEEYAKLIESQSQDQQTMNKEKLQLIKEREEMKQKLEQARDLHSRALEAMVVATQEGYKPVSIPYQDEIDTLRDKIHADTTTMIYEMQLIYGLLASQAKLEGLLKKLYEESRLSFEAEHKHIEGDLFELARDALRVRGQHVDQRKNILQNIKDKGLTGCGEEDITSLQNANQQVADTEKALQEIARQNAYLKAISKVKDLIKECKTEVRDAITRRNAATKIDQLPSQFATRVADPLALLTPLNDQPAVSENEEDKMLLLYKDPETIADIIYQKVSLYKDLHQFYRTRLSTEIVDGLAKVNKRLPIPFPGCKISRLIEIRNEVGKWVDKVQYALRLSKELNKGDNRSIVARFFMKFLTFVKKAFSTLSHRKQKETNLEDDVEFTKSIEKFDEQERFDFDKYFKYIKEHFSTLDIDANVSEGELREFRYNLISVRITPEVLEKNTLRVLKEIDESSKTEKKAVELVGILKEADIAEKRLQLLYSSLISEIKSTLKKKDREYQEVLEEYQRCRYSIFRGLPIFSNIR